MEDGGEILDTIAAPVRTETVVTRSRFIADLVPIQDPDGAEISLASARREFHDARHHCSAFVLGVHGELHRWSDDGEPSGTAGAPMLAVLQGAGLTDVTAIVTRYFGGTLLGSGGLVRAYGGAVTGALVEVRRVRRRLVTVFRIVASHADAGQLEHRLRVWAATDGARVEPGRYTSAGVTLELAVPAASIAGLRAVLDGGGITHEVHEVGQAVRRLRS